MVCPALVPPGEWRPVIPGDGEGAFDDGDEANDIPGPIMVRHNENILAMGRGRPEPIMNDDGTPLWEIRMEGFVAAMALRPESRTVYRGSADETESRMAARARGSRRRRPPHPKARIGSRPSQASAAP